MKQTLAIIIVALAVAGILHLSSQRGQKLAQSAQAYEECVLQETGMTPHAYYADTGTMLECPVDNK